MIMHHIVVCVKPVGGELNPFDASALECALRMQGAEVTAISMGPPGVAPVLRGLTRLGVFRAILLTDPAFAGSDTLATAYALSRAVKKLAPDLILCGRQSIDGDTGQVGPGLAAMLGLPVLTAVMAVNNLGDTVRCTSRAGEEEARLPAVLTVERMAPLRFPGIRSRVREAEIWSAADITADPGRCGLAGSPTRVLQTFECTIGRRHCVFIRPDQMDEAIARALRKPLSPIPESAPGQRFPMVWSVGEEPIGMARTIAEKVRVIPRQEPAAIVELAEREKPPVILWDGTIWGRRNAPQAAALLRTGLCADCTRLETDGERLWMYRPALGGSVMAKVICRTLPQMATVRTLQSGGEAVVLAAGLGAAGELPRLRTFAESRGFAMAASRPLVDRGLAPYPWQVGLTGRSVSPRVYIACGISGAVQHTCAIEQAGTVIAVNPDKNARIFEYADYGILAPVREVFDRP